MGIVECMDKSTGRTWTAVYSGGPHMGLVAENWRDAKEKFDLIAEDNTRISLPLEEIPRLSELEGGLGVDPDKYAKLIGSGVVEAAKGML